MRCFVAALLVLLVGCTGEVRRARSPKTQLPPTPTPGEVAKPPEGAYLRDFWVLDLSFVHRRVGYALGSGQVGGRRTITIHRTVDGGRTWTRRRAPAARQAPEGWRPKDGVSQLEFSSRKIGWAFGPGLYVTRDGGRTWRAENLGTEVIALEAAEDSVWAATRTCTKSAGCAYGLLVSADSGATWRLSNADVAGPQVQIERIGSDTGWIVSYGYGPNGRAHDDRIISTSDRGTMWRELSSPCPYYYSIDVVLSAADESNLWVLCGFGAGAGSQKKTLRHSQDGGLTWGPRIAAPYGGYSFVMGAVSKRGALIAGVGSPLMRTRDGGGSWNIERSIGDDAGWSVIKFADVENGWVAHRDLVLRTANGGHAWTGSFVKVPPGRAQKER